MKSENKKILLPTKGVCNLNPPQICDDTELLDAEGLTFCDNAIRPIQDVADFIENKNIYGELMFVHNLNNGDKLYLMWVESDHHIGVHNEKGGYLEPINLKNNANALQIKSIGNSLIINTDKGLTYYFYKPTTVGKTTTYYQYLGDSIPFPDITFQLKLKDEDGYWTMFDIEDITEKKSTTDGLILYGAVTGGSNYSFDTVVNGVLACYSEAKNKIAKDKCFIMPFFVRYAIELYDGSIVCASGPILMLPTITDNCFADVYNKTTHDLTKDATVSRQNICMNFLASRLYYTCSYDFSDWKDIINNIVVYVSDQIDIYDNTRLEQESKASSTITFKFKENAVHHNAIYGSYYEKSHTSKSGEINACLELLHKRDTSDVIESLKTTSLFYKISELGLKHTADDQILAIKDKILENLLTQSSISNAEDFYSHCSFTPDKIETFNQRLNITGVKRSFYKGFKQFVPYLNPNLTSDYYYRYKIEVTISSSSGDVLVSNEFSSKDIFYENMWFFYPDTRATHVKVTSDNSTIFDKDLETHQGLSGAFYIGTALPTGSEKTDWATSEKSEDVSILPDAEVLQNYLLQSEADNPFTFFSSGYVRVGQGAILGMAGLTTALTQDAYKVSTTLVFTTQGIWAVTVDSTGQYASVAPPFSREVAIETADICMIDHGVFFVSEKGLMLINDDGVRCVSTQLNGRNPSTFDNTLGCQYKDFNTFLKNCKMAYDYRDSQLWIINSEKDSNNKYLFDYHWVYNMKSGTFTRKADNRHFKSVCTDYPDTLLHDTNNIICSMINKPNINYGDDCDGFFITRPVKFDESIKMKTLKELLNIYDSPDDNTQITVEIYGSDNTYDWTKLTSLYGRGYKYFTFKLAFKYMRPSDTYSGTVIGYDTRYTDKIR